MTAIIGRKGCTWCGFESAHVKQTDGKHPYHHCPHCGIMTHAKNGAQAALITANMRPEPNYKAGPPVPPPTDNPIIVPGVVVKDGAKTERAPEQDKSAKPAKRAGLWAQLMPGSGE
ncbi:MAG TPA: hypothetical protein H9903_10515 [Candidatus Aquabacterium excrementipullorum]|nr:hypothetical protein [Candidatus Aquabacterium excrementipullorum]